LTLGWHDVGALHEQPLAGCESPDHCKAYGYWGPAADGEVCVEEDGDESSFLNDGHVLHGADVSGAAPEALIVCEEAADACCSVAYLGCIAAVDDDVAGEHGEDGAAVSVCVGAEEELCLVLDVWFWCGGGLGVGQHGAKD
jgi:hypothetical protein